ncbi:MAG: peptidoglycan-binding domain-containing protein [Bacteroidota bacterium]
MKRLFYIITIICLPLIAFFMFDSYRRHHPESVYAYQPAQDIDHSYYDPDVLLRYHQLCEEIGSYGRYCWKEERVDVLREDITDGEAGPMIQRYQSLIAAARYLEGKLLQSQKWKAEGYSNKQIARAEEGRSTEGETTPNIGPLAKLGDQNALIMATQEKLQAKGYTLQMDGIFRTETETAIKQFQTDQSLSPSGILDLSTFLALWQ